MHKRYLGRCSSWSKPSLGPQLSPTFTIRAESFGKSMGSEEAHYFAGVWYRSFPVVSRWNTHH